jgi:pimeloyl-ACP methyl ester carboxylesterase
MTILPVMPPARRFTLPCGGWLNVHQQAGRGPALVLIHGFTDCAASFRLVLPHLAGRHLLIPDLRGHGASFRGDITDVDTFAVDIESVVAQLGLGQVILVGHSMGALVAVQLALRNRMSVVGLVTLSGSLRPGGSALRALMAQMDNLPDPVPIDHPFLNAWYACSRPVPAAFIDPLRASCIGMRRRDWQACLAVLERSDLRPLAQTLQIHSMVLSGQCDEIFPPSHHADLVAALAPMRSAAFADVGHNPHWEVPDQVAAEINAFAGLLGLRQSASTRS